MSTFTKKRYFSWFLICTSIAFFIWFALACIECTPSNGRAIVQGTVTSISNISSNTRVTWIDFAYHGHRNHIHIEDYHYTLGDKVPILVKKDELHQATIYAPIDLWPTPLAILWAGLGCLICGSGWLYYWHHMRYHIKNFAEPPAGNPEDEKSQWWGYLSTILFISTLVNSLKVKLITERSIDEYPLFLLAIGCLIILSAFIFIWFTRKQKHTHISLATILGPSRKPSIYNPNEKIPLLVEFTPANSEPITREVQHISPNSNIRQGTKGYITYNPNNFKKIVWITYTFWGTFSLLLWSGTYIITISLLALITN